AKDVVKIRRDAPIEMLGPLGCGLQTGAGAVPNFAVAPAKDVVKIRRDAPIEMLGPLGCGLQTGAGAVLNVMQPAAGQSIAVSGVGGVGLAGLMAARIAGCDPIIAFDRLPSRLALRATPSLERHG